RPLRRDGSRRRRRKSQGAVERAPALARDAVGGLMRVDAIVVGGGPGGSTAAWRLAGAGLRTVLLDAAAFPRVKVCAGWVTRAALDDLELDAEKYPLTIQPFSACVLAFEGRRYETRWSRPASYGIARREFCHYQLQRPAAS